MISSGARKRGPDSRAPDWYADPAKYAAKVERDKLERGELVIALGPFCVPCGKRFAKQSVYDAHLSGKKHLTALQRMGRDEEAMVCQLDIEAKRRKMQAADDARQQAMAPRPQVHVAVEEEAAAAARRAAREEKLRERAMLPMPAIVAAASVYGVPEEEDDEAAAAPSTTVTTVPAPEPEADPIAMAAAASGVSMSYFAGKQDLSQQANRLTSTTIAAQHRKLAVVADDWFNPKPRE